MRIFFIILTWNSKSVIEKCLNSILAFQKIETRIIVIDNGSKDQTAAIVQRVQEKAKRSSERFMLVQLVKNRGTTLSRNIGIAIALNAAKDNDCVCILDSDTEISEQAINALANILHETSSVGIVGPRMVTREGCIQPSARKIPTVPQKLKWLKNTCEMERIFKQDIEKASHIYTDSAGIYAGYLTSACWMMKPSLFKEIGLLDEQIFYAPEDAEFCIRAWKNGKKVLYCPNVCVVHHWQRLSRKKLFSKHNWEHLKGLMHMYIKHRFFFSDINIRRQVESQGPDFAQINF